MASSPTDSSDSAEDVSPSGFTASGCDAAHVWPMSRGGGASPGGKANREPLVNDGASPPRASASVVAPESEHSMAMGSSATTFSEVGGAWAKSSKTVKDDGGRRSTCAMLIVPIGVRTSGSLRGLTSIAAHMPPPPIGVGSAAFTGLPSKSLRSSPFCTWSVMSPRKQRRRAGLGGKSTFCGVPWPPIPLGTKSEALAENEELQPPKPLHRNGVCESAPTPPPIPLAGFGVKRGVPGFGVTRGGVHGTAAPPSSRATRAGDGYSSHIFRPPRRSTSRQSSTTSPAA
mmetsp:Transcript_39108/g.112410  ORF Transcript_39108/g.112410 Transcript_39108/m.112410 type:complete len:286 (-) Transcript_39108:132-989(-)